MERLHLVATEQEKTLGAEIILEDLGPDFCLNWGLYPPNKGIKGDEGVFGETVEIEGKIAEPIKFLVEESELLARVSSRLCNELASVTKVLFNIGQLDES